jgi:hypothetical protein
MRSPRAGFVNLLVFGVLFVLLTGGIAYVYHQQNQPKGQSENSNVKTDPPKHVINPQTADWVSYTSDKYGYTLRYPASWLARCGEPETGDKDCVRLTIEPKECIGGIRTATSTCGLFSIIRGLATTTTVKDFLLNDSNLNGIDETLQDQRPVTVDGHAGYGIGVEFMEERGPNDFQKRIALENNGLVYMIVFDQETLSPDQWILMPVFDNIVSSLHFTDVSSSDQK